MKLICSAGGMNISSATTFNITIGTNIRYHFSATKYGCIFRSIRQHTERTVRKVKRCSPGSINMVGDPNVATKDIANCATGRNDKFANCLKEARS